MRIKGTKKLRVLKPCSPVLAGEKAGEIVYAKNQPQYIPLPAITNKDGMATTRWRMCWRDRLLALFTGNVYIQIMTFKHPLQPLRVMVVKPLKEDVI